MAGRGFKFCKLFINSMFNPVYVPQNGIKSYVKFQSSELQKRQKKYFEDITEEEYNELHKRSNFLEWNYSAEIFAFGQRLQENFTPELLVQAFTQRSYVVKEEIKQSEVGISTPSLNLQDNRSLASEGEKIISDYVPKYVSHFFPRFPLEGIEAIKDYLGSDEVLSYISKNLGTTFLILSADYPVQIETYSQTLKAIVGALKECQGLERTNLFVRDFILTQLVGKDVNDFLKIDSPLQTLSDILKRDGKEPPEPRIICQSSMNTIMANYHIGIYSNKKLIGHCSGESIDVAVDMAAFDALKRLFHTTDSCSPITYDLQKVPENVKNLTLSQWNSAAFMKSSSLQI